MKSIKNEYCNNVIKMFHCSTSYTMRLFAVRPELGKITKFW